MRLIDADELERLFNAQVEQGAMDLVAAFADALQDAQTVDTIPAVRCRECRYCVKTADYAGIGLFCSIWGRGWHQVQADDYCSCGKLQTNATPKAFEYNPFNEPKESGDLDA